MKLIIDITEETYHRCCAIAELDGLPILIAIKNGTPLPPDLYKKPQTETDYTVSDRTEVRE